MENIETIPTRLHASELPVRVRFSYTAPAPENITSRAEDCHPAEPAEVSLLAVNVQLRGGHTYNILNTLRAFERECLANACYEYLEKEVSDADGKQGTDPAA